MKAAEQAKSEFKYEKPHDLLSYADSGRNEECGECKSRGITSGPWNRLLDHSSGVQCEALLARSGDEK